MQTVSLGLIRVPTPGTPVRVTTDESLHVAMMTVQTVPGFTGKTYVGGPSPAWFECSANRLRSGRRMGKSCRPRRPDMVTCCGRRTFGWMPTWPMKALRLPVTCFSWPGGSAPPHRHR
jgi:hypothetical protein